MGEQSASRLEGDRYQHLYAWYELLQLLDEPSDYSHAYVEHPDSGAVDDVTLHARPGSGKASRYVQVKWHVDLRSSYSWDSLSASTGRSKSLLAKLFESWRILRERGEKTLEIWLVSNWSPDETLGRSIVGRDHRLDESFFSSAGAGSLSVLMEGWCEQFRATPEQVRGFLRDLRFRLGFSSIADLGAQLDDRLGRLGLRMGEPPRAILLDSMRGMIEVSGDGKRVTGDSLRAFLQAQSLFAAPDNAPAVSLWIHGWARRKWDRPPTVELDWTSHFDRNTRGLPDAMIWQERLLPELRGAMQRLGAQDSGTFIDFRGKVPLGVALAVGAVFPAVAGFRFRAEQVVEGETFLWQSDAKGSSRKLQMEERDGAADAKALLVLFQLTGNGREDLERFAKENPGRFRKVLILEPEGGPSSTAVQSAADAVAFASQARESLRDARRACGASSTHLLLYAPATSCLFLGQRLNAVGPIVVYERTHDERYTPFVTVETG
ncbi:hypothetical protein DRW03_18330 [Corallococcus sp. H22C18031201]|nr:hypothetical protein DRW03_18330 [Corallococcus sp. H22C18031201]